MTDRDYTDSQANTIFHSGFLKIYLNSRVEFVKYVLLL